MNEGERSPGEKEAAEMELDKYHREMQGALADMMVETAQRGQPSDVRAAFEASLKINQAFEAVVSDAAGNLDDAASQETINQPIQMLGLDAKKFSLARFRELFKNAGQ